MNWVSVDKYRHYCRDNRVVFYIRGALAYFGSLNVDKFPPKIVVQKGQYE